MSFAIKISATDFSLIKTPIEPRNYDVALLTLNQTCQILFEENLTLKLDSHTHFSKEQSIEILKNLALQIYKIYTTNSPAIYSSQVKKIKTTAEKVFKILDRHEQILNNTLRLISFIKEGNYEKCRSLIEEGIEINFKNENGETPLHLATKLELSEICSILIQKKADLNAKDKEGNTPLHLAALSDSEEMCKLLLKNGAPIQAKNEKGQTSLHITIANNNKKACKFLIKNKADLNAKNNKGATLLHWAAQTNDKELCELLLEHDADINVQDLDGNTPLHITIISDNRGLYNFLIKNNANTHIKNKMGHTPSDIRRLKIDKILEQLIERRKRKLLSSESV